MSEALAKSGTTRAVFHFFQLAAARLVHIRPNLNREIAQCNRTTSCNLAKQDAARKRFVKMCPFNSG